MATKKTDSSSNKSVWLIGGIAALIAVAAIIAVAYQSGGDEVVEGDDLEAIGQQPVDEMGRNETGTARDEGGLTGELAGVGNHGGWLEGTLPPVVDCPISGGQNLRVDSANGTAADGSIGSASCMTIPAECSIKNEQTFGHLHRVVGSSSPWRRSGFSRARSGCHHPSFSRYQSTVAASATSQECCGAQPRVSRSNPASVA